MKQQTLNFEAIGTRWTIQAACNDSTWTEITQRIQKRIEIFDQTYSRFRDDSWVAQLAKKPGAYQLPKDAYPLLQFYDQLYVATKGKVTPLIGQTISDAGYDAKYSLKSKALRNPPRWEDVIEYDKTKITLHQPALLDFGAAGKGYLVDIIGDLLADSGLTEFLINAGGDILYRSKTDEELRVGLENPQNTSEVIGVASIKNQSLCASAGSRRQWGKYHHLIDPQNLESPTEIIASWVIAPTTMLADGLATALFFVEPDKLTDFDFSYARLHHDMSLERSKDFSAEIYEAVA